MKFTQTISQLLELLSFQRTPFVNWLWKFKRLSNRYIKQRVIIDENAILFHYWLVVH